MVTVSHDRYLLDETVSRIAELEEGVVTMWPGNYSAYAVAKEIALKRQQQLYVTQQKEIARLEEAIKRFEDWARSWSEQRHITQARNKQRQIDRMDKVDKPVFERRKIALEMRSAERGGIQGRDPRRCDRGLRRRPGAARICDMAISAASASA